VSTGGRVFVARLAGLPVFDPNGDQVGRVRDVVVALRADSEAPRALGLTVEIQGRRRIFVPMGRLTSVESDAVILSSGSLNLRRFEQRDGETLVLAELLDRHVVVNEDGSEASVVDVAMEQNRTDWLVTKVAVRKGRGRRRSELLTLEWDEVTGLGVPEHEQGAANLLAVLEKLRPADLAGVLHDLSHKRRG
jgi:uncharacterized protein YrrD